LRERSSGVIIAAVMLLSAACAPAASTPAATAPGAGAAPPPAAPATPKSLIISQDFEPPDIEGFGSLVRPAGTGGVREIVHNHLTRKIRDGVVEPELVTGLPSIDDGTWKVNADGTMDVTWKLRPNVKWHDGTPFTSADMRFAFEAFTDPALPPMA